MHINEWNVVSKTSYHYFFLMSVLNVIVIVIRLHVVNHFLIVIILSVTYDIINAVNPDVNRCFSTFKPCYIQVDIRMQFPPIWSTFYWLCHFCTCSQCYKISKLQHQEQNCLKEKIVESVCSRNVKITSCTGLLNMCNRGTFTS